VMWSPERFGQTSEAEDKSISISLLPLLLYTSRCVACCVRNSNSSATDQELYLAVPSTAHQLAPTYLSTVTCSTCPTPVIDTSQSTCLTPDEITTAAALNNDDKDDNTVDGANNDDSSVIQSIAQLLTSSTACVRRSSVNVYVTCRLLLSSV